MRQSNLDHQINQLDVTQNCHTSMHCSDGDTSRNFMSSNTILYSTGPLKPFDPGLASLSHELAMQVVAGRYITVASLTVSR